MGQKARYGTVLAERPIRRLLLASVAGRVAFAMLPLGLVLFAAAETGSTAVSGTLIAAFAVTSSLAPLRGRAVDRRGPRALVAFSIACAFCVGLLLGAAALDASRLVLVVLGGLAGLFVPPLGPFTRAIWGVALREHEPRLQRVYALDSAGEEGAAIVGPLVVALAVAVGSPSLALAVAAAGLALGTLASARSSLAGLATGSMAPDSEERLGRALWLLFAAFVPTAAALGAIDIAVPAAARAQGHPAAAGVLLAAMAVGTVAGSLLAGRWTWQTPQRRVIALQALFAVGLVVAALAWASLGALGALLVLPGAALGALFASLYLLVDRLAPSGAGTRTFGWLVTANNGGLALGAAAAGALSGDAGPQAGLWLAAGCALMGIAPVMAAASLSARGHGATQVP